MTQAVVASLSLARHRFDFRPVHVRFERDEVALGQVFLRVLHFSVSITLPVPHTHLCLTWCNLSN